MARRGYITQDETIKAVFGQAWREPLGRLLDTLTARKINVVQIRQTVAFARQQGWEKFPVAKPKLG